MGGLLFNLKVIIEKEEYIVHACEASFAYKNNS